MKNNKIDKYFEDYEGRCKIIPCRDLMKFEGNMDETKEEILEAFREERIISDWSLKEGIFDNGELVQKEDDEDCIDDEDEYIWNELVCYCMKNGYLVIYEVPVPYNVKKKEDGTFSSFSYSWGHYQTHYIHLDDLMQLTPILKNIDEEMKEQAYKEEQENKKEKLNA